MAIFKVYEIILAFNFRRNQILFYSVNMTYITDKWFQKIFYD